MAVQFANRSSVPPRYSPLRNRNNVRKYEGTYQFNREQTYEGEFLRDSLHGQGTYNWLNVAFYDGGFYSNCKEGYASISFPDSSYFEGLFVGNQPFGPGILTHANGRQDAGFWKGRKLVRLSRAVDFIIPRLAPTSAAKIKLLQFRRLIPVEEENTSVTDILEKYGHSESISAPFSPAIYDRRSVFFHKRAFEKAYFAAPKRRTDLLSSPSLSGQFEEEEEEEEEEGEEEETLDEEFADNPVPSHCLCPSEVFVMEYEKESSVDVCEKESLVGEYEMGILGYFNKYGTEDKLEGEGEEESDMYLHYLEESMMEKEDAKKDFSKVPKIVSWNRNELCTEMLKQIFRFRHFEGKLNFNLSKLMVGARTAFRKTGENEMQCLHFLKMCSLGPAHVVKGILCAFQISEELMDARGNNSLMFAAATDKRDVIEVLLNYGVDMNTFNDEGLTPLNLCLLRRLAYAYGISNWETAFLPKEIDETQYEDPHAHGYPTTESISSLDRIFGDGMSLDESSILGLSSVVMSPPPPSAVGGGSSERKKEERTEASKHILPVTPSKTQTSISMINWEWEFRPGKSVSLLALSNPTPTLNIKIIPKSVRRDEFQRSLQRSSKDKYLFEISFEPKPEAEDLDEATSSPRKKHSKKEGHKKEEHKKEEHKKVEDTDSEDEPTESGRSFEFDVTERIAEIDKTIQLLLDRGADPNLSEVPKPSIHLAVYTKDLKTVQNLLSHGANPDSVLHANEGLLTPLHVIVLQKPTPEYVHICDLLLNFKANPDKETLPGFSITEEEKAYLDPEQGRTPLHLLCMRPDLEYADPHGYLIKIALMLARVCQKKHFYNGHSYLTLAMLFGNMRLLKAFLIAEVFDPKDVLGKNRGTCLHVLVSGELQKRTPYNISTQMCDLLIGAGADPLKTFKNPRNLLGTCVDYGYRELGMLREARISEEFKGFKRSFSKARDSLKDHEKVIEYLAVIVGETAKLKRKHFLEVGRFQRYKPSTDRWKHHRGSTRRIRRGTSGGIENFSSGTFVDSEGSRETYLSLEDKASKLILPSRRSQGKDKTDTEDEMDKKEVKDKKLDQKEVQDKKKMKDKKQAGDSENRPKKKEETKKEGEDKSGKKSAKRKKLSFDNDIEDHEDTSKRFGGKFSEKGKRERKDSIALARLRDSVGPVSKGKRESKNSLSKIGKRESSSLRTKGKGSGETMKESSSGKIQLTRKTRIKIADDVTEMTRRRLTEERRGDVPEREGRKQSISKKGGRRLTGKEELEDGKAEMDRKQRTSEAREREKTQAAGGGSRAALNLRGRDPTMPGLDISSFRAQRGRDSSGMGADVSSFRMQRGRDSSAVGADVSSLRTVSDRRTSTTEVFPENLRRVLLRLYGNCANMDVNEFLMPYVVLRDGQLYYKFKGKATKQKEQYSLI